MTKGESEITEIVNRETKAWDTQDVNLLISVFHPDMVWPWPRTIESHDPMDWIMPLAGTTKSAGAGAGRSFSTLTGWFIISGISGR